MNVSLPIISLRALYLKFSNLGFQQVTIAIGPFVSSTKSKGEEA